MKLIIEISDKLNEKIKDVFYTGEEISTDMLSELIRVIASGKVIIEEDPE